MRAGWRGGGLETPCGSGSTNAGAAKARVWLPQIFKKYDIKLVCDAGAGDMRWHGGIFKGMIYYPFDLVPRSPKVYRFDITKKTLPECDAILCRHVLVHFDPSRIARTVEFFKQSGNYLIASQYPNARGFDYREQYNPIDLRPLLGEPLEQCEDTLVPDTYLAIWKLRNA